MLRQNLFIAKNIAGKKQSAKKVVSKTETKATARHRNSNFVHVIKAYYSETVYNLYSYSYIDSLCYSDMP